MAKTLKTIATVWVYVSSDSTDTYITLADVVVDNMENILEAIPFSWNYPESGEPFKRYYTALSLNEIADYVIED